MKRSFSLICGLLSYATAVASPAQAVASSDMSNHAEETALSGPDTALPSISPSLEKWSLADAEKNDIPSGTSIELPQPENVPLAARNENQYTSFGKQAGAVKWEMAGIAAYMTAINLHQVIEDPQTFRFSDEGWFGRSTDNLGIDKIRHAYNAYIIADFLHSAMIRKTGGGHGEPLTAAILASGLSLYTELYDAHHKGSGFSLQDALFNTLGAGFSVLRNTTPGLKDKLDFRMEITPNSKLTRIPPRSDRFVLAVTLAGFKTFKNSPLRFLELQAGYHASGYSPSDRAAGEPLKRRLFVGIGLNIQELFFRSPRSGIARATGSLLDYVQIPYTAIYSD